MTKREEGVKEIGGGQGEERGMERAYMDGTKNCSLPSALTEVISSTFQRLFPLAGLVRALS